MFHIRRRLIILFVIIITLTLSVSGTFSYYQMRKERLADLELIGNTTRTRLETALPGVIWNFDENQLWRTLDAEMRSPLLSMLAVEVDGTIIAGLRRNGSEIEQFNSLPPVKGDEIEFELFYQENHQHSLGKVILSISRAQMEAQLRKIVTDKIIEIIVLDIVILLALSQSLSLVLIRPLRQLRDMLDLAAQQNNTDSSAQDLHLPQSRYQEFAEVVDGYNRIAKTLLNNLHEREKAEDHMREARDAAEQAYRKLKEAQTSLVQSEKMASLGSLVAGIAHEINTPIGIIMTGASVLDEETKAFTTELDSGALKKSTVTRYAETARQSSRLIMGNAERAATLIQSFKRVAVDQTSEARRNFNLKGYLDEVVLSLRPILKTSMVQVIIDCPDEIQMDTYPGALSQILTNLVTNVLVHAFTEDNRGQISISARPEEEWVTLDFHDNGQGIAPEHIRRIFDPFFTTRRGDGGSGLGLHIVYNLVTQTLGGTIAVESTQGEGTSFIIKLPLVAPIAGPAPTDATPNAPTSA